MPLIIRGSVRARFKVRFSAAIAARNVSRSLSKTSIPPGSRPARASSPRTTWSEARFLEPISVKTSEPVLPDGQVPDIGSLSGAASSLFSLKAGEISGPILTGANGIVAQILDKQSPTEQDFASKKDQIRQTLLDAKENEMFSLYVSNMRKELEKSNKLKVNQEEIKNLSKRSDEGM